MNSMISYFKMYEIQIPEKQQLVKLDTKSNIIMSSIIFIKETESPFGAFTLLSGQGNNCHREGTQ